MKKLLALLVALMMVIALCPAALAQNSITVRVDATDTSPFGAFEGWGTSLCWWANHFGDLAEDERKALCAAFFDEKTGLGLNIARYNIGGGDDPTHTHLSEGMRAVPGYMDKSGKYNFDADRNQVNILKDAISYGCDIVEAFSNSPPYFMTKSGCASGGEDPNQNNIDPSKFNAFADYLTEVVKYLRDKEGVKVNTLEPMNEPYTNYWRAGGSQEGCHIDFKDHSALIVSVANALKKKGLTDTVVAAADETSVDTMLSYLPEYSDAAKKAIGQLNVHTYWANNYTSLRDMAVSMGKKLYMSEVDGAKSIGTAAGNMGPALWLSHTITKDLRSLEAAAWCIWQVTGPAYNGSHSDGGYWYLSQYDRASKKLDLFKKYYAFAQYTKFIRPGYYLMATDSDTTLCAYDAASGKIVLVATNPKPYDVNAVFDLSGFATTGTALEAYRTSKTQDCEKIQSGTLSGKKLSATLEQNTITTYVITPSAAPTGEIRGMSIHEKTGVKSTFAGRTLSLSAAFLPEGLKNVPSVTWSVADGGANIASVDQTGNVTVSGIGNFSVTAASGEMSGTLEFSSIGDGSLVQIVNKRSGMALAPDGNGTLMQSEVSDNSNQYWKVVRSYAGYTFVNLRTGEALDGGLSLHMGKYAGGIPQMWKFIDADGGYALENSETHKTIDVFDSSSAEGAKVDMYDANGGDNQIWNFIISPRTTVLEDVEDGCVKIDAKAIEGSAPYKDNSTTAFDKACDGDITTYFDSADAQGSAVFDLGTESAVTLIEYAPRKGHAERMIGGTFYASNDKKDWTALTTLTEAPPEGMLSRVYFENTTAYRYIKYLSPENGYANIAEAAFYAAPLAIDAQLHKTLDVKVTNYGETRDVTLSVTYFKAGVESAKDRVTKPCAKGAAAEFSLEVKSGFDYAVIDCANTFGAYIHF